MRLPERIGLSVFGCFLICLAHFTSACAEFHDSPPDLTRGGKKDDQTDWTLGPTGARGWIWGKQIATTGATQILITMVDKGSPAEGVLRKGDVILGAAGKAFANDARIELGRAITQAESNAGGGSLALNRWRNGKQEQVTIQLPVLGDYAPTAPFNCPKSQRVLEKALAHLSLQELQVYGAGGDLHEIPALALLATGRKEYEAKLKKYAADLVERYQNPDHAFGSNWYWGFENLYLCEYHLVSGDKSVLPTIRFLSTRLAQTQSASGSWGHNPPLPQSVDGRLEGYGAVNQVGLLCWLSLTLAQKCDVHSPAIDAAAEKSRLFFRFYAGKGSIPYGDHPTAFQWHDDNGKNANAAIAYDLLQDHQATRYFGRMATAAYLEREGGHTGNYFNFLWGPLGVNRLGPEAVAAHQRYHHWWYDLGRKWDGSFPYQGNPGEEDSYEGWDVTSMIVLTLALPQRRLFITGKGTHPENALTGEALAQTIAAGRDFSHPKLDTCYDHHPVNQLFEELTSWSPSVRYRAAKAIAAKEQNFNPRLISMLRSESWYAKCGACAALEFSGEKAEPAVDALVPLLDQPDIWLRICAANALAGIGPPARRAAPNLLRARLKVDPADSRGSSARYLTMALFDGYSGLMRDTMDGLDRGQLREAIKQTLSLPDGLSRKGASSAYKHLKQDDMQELWPYIVRSIQEAAPSGEMFADEIRVSGVELMAQRKIKEGPQVIVQLARNQNLWNSEDRIDPILKALTSYGTAAQSALPDLEALIPVFEKQDFPDDPKAKKIAILKAAIETIRNADTGPQQMRSIAQFVPAEYLQPRHLFDEIKPERIAGKYRREPAENDWHSGELKVAAVNARGFPTFTWTNTAGVTWPLVYDRENGQLRCDPTSPYYDDVENGRAFRLILRRNKDGKYLLNVASFRYCNEVYVKEKRGD